MDNDKMREARTKPELLAPAGSMEKLEVALAFGADAVYLGGKAFSLRRGSNNFSNDELMKAVTYCHKKNKKIYVAVNIVPHNNHIDGIIEYVKYLGEICVDGIIASDPGVINILKLYAPKIPIHLSTQANTTNWVTAKFWENQGIKRIILGRELSLEEIKEVAENTSLPLEAFVHGSMCISYSGRCLLSAYMTERSGNLGDCSHPCRWKYHLMEEKRPGEYFPVLEDEYGTYVLNSKDLCMIKHIPELIDGGLKSFKIEGRMKGVHYVASITKSYRQAIDAYWNNPHCYTVPEETLEEVYKSNHRPYTTGFYFHIPEKERQNYETSSYIRKYNFVGVVKEYDLQSRTALVQVRNRIKLGEEVEFLRPHKPMCKTVIEQMVNGDGKEIDQAHAGYTIKIYVKDNLEKYTILRIADSEDR